MTSVRRKHLEPAWLLHHRPWSDTSRIVVFGAIIVFIAGQIILNGVLLAAAALVIWVAAPLNRVTR